MDFEKINEPVEDLVDMMVPEEIEDFELVEEFVEPVSDELSEKMFRIMEAHQKERGNDFVLVNQLEGDKVRIMVYGKKKKKKDKDTKKGKKKKKK